MTNKNNELDTIYRKLVAWFKDVEQHEVTSVVDIIEKAKSFLLAAESIPAEKVKQFVDNLKYDLTEFYQQNQADVQHSIYLSLLKEAFWEQLAKMTDKSQVEWAELVDDFEHQGEYHQGDVIGFGVLQCRRCHKKVTIFHISTVGTCPHCGGDDFTRFALEP